MRKKPFLAHYKSRHFHVNMLPEDAFNAAIKVLEEMGTKIVLKDRYSGTIRAFKGWRLISSGDFISITIKDGRKTQGTEILIESELAFGRIFEFGVNTSNINLFEKLFYEEEHRKVENK